MENYRSKKQPLFGEIMQSPAVFYATVGERPKYAGKKFQTWIQTVHVFFFLTDSAKGNEFNLLIRPQGFRKEVRKTRK